MAGPKRATAFTFSVALTSTADTDVFQATPTLAAGDIQVSGDYAQFVNLATFPPTVIDLASGADSGALAVTLTAAEMTHDKVLVLFHDATAIKEWQDLLVFIDVETGTISEIVDDTGTSGVVIANTQGAITWGQQVIAANVDGQGALDIRNAHVTGYGLYTRGYYGGYNFGTHSGQRNYGNGSYGLLNEGALSGQHNDGTADYGIEATGGTDEVNWLDDIADEVWAEAVPGAYVPGSAGYVLGNWAGVDVNLVSPIVDDDEITLYQGDDYYDADERDLEWTETGSTWPDITAATVTCYFRSPANDKMSVPGVVSVGGGGPGQAVRVELSAAQTATLANWPQPTHFRVRLTLASGHKVTLVAGRVNVEYDIA